MQHSRPQTEDGQASRRKFSVEAAMDELGDRISPLSAAIDRHLLLNSLSHTDRIHRFLLLFFIVVVGLRIGENEKRTLLAAS